MRSIMNKRGQVTELVGGTVLGVLTLVFLIFAVLFAISSLNPASFFTANSANANVTTAMVNNVTNGVGNFSQYIPTVMLVLGVVFVLSGILILIIYVRRMSTGGGAGTL